MIKKEKTEAEAKVAELINDLQRTRADFEKSAKRIHICRLDVNCRSEGHIVLLARIVRADIRG